MDAESFWKNVTRILRDRKISQESLCDEIGISIWTLRSSISKKILPRVDVAKRIADYLDITVDFLLTGVEGDEYRRRLENLKRAMRDLIEEEGK